MTDGHVTEERRLANSNFLDPSGAAGLPFGLRWQFTSGYIFQETSSHIEA
jgi:hypothetical protein